MAIERLSGGDQMMRRVSKVWPQDNGALLLIDGANFRFERVLELIEARLPTIPRFRQVIHDAPRGLGDPVWVDARAFELKNHVHARALPAPGDEAQLLSTLEELRRERLNPDQPLWQLWFLIGLSDGRVAVFAKVNHAIADGMALMGALSTFLDAEPGIAERRIGTWHPSPPPSTEELFEDNLRRRLDAARAFVSPKTIARNLSALPTARELFAEEPATPSSLDRLASDRRRIALLRSSLDTFKAIAHAHSVSVNDVLLAVISGGLRTLLERRRELQPGFTVRAYVPTSLRSGGAVQGNEVAEMVVPLPVALSDQAALLQAIAAETRRRKARGRSALTGLLKSRLIERLMMKALDRQHVNVTTANLRGPPAPLYLCGAKVHEVFPVLPLIGKAALGVAAVSYAGQLNLTIVADEGAYPDLELFLAGAKAELAALTVARPRKSIDEEAFLELGGVKQWVLIRGEDTSNPPLILLHGGPGMSESGFFRFYNAALERRFTCVNWDQRGAGKSFDETIPKESMTVEQFLSDLDELVEHVRKRLHQDRVVLLGHSWGSALGVLYAARFPEKVSAYVGSGQIGDAMKGEAESYAYGLAEAERRGNRKALKALRSIGAPPYPSAEKLFIERNVVTRLDGGLSPRAMLRMLRMILGVKEASLFDVPATFRALRWSIDATWAEASRLNLLTAVPKLKMPVFFFLGRKDHWVPPQVSVEYYEALDAPSKELLWFERSGHEPFADEPEKFNAAMVERVLPVART